MDSKEIVLIATIITIIFEHICAGKYILYISGSQRVGWGNSPEGKMYILPSDDEITRI